MQSKKKAIKNMKHNHCTNSCLPIPNIQILKSSKSNSKSKSKSKSNSSHQ